MKVLHVLYQSLPHQSGSTTRSVHILRAQQEAGIDVAVISSPFQAGNGEVDVESVNGVDHYRTLPKLSLIKGFSNSGIIRKIIKLSTLPYFVYRTYKLTKQLKPSLIHAHAMFYCAIAAVIAGKLCGIPCVYEVRSIWYIHSNAGLGGLQQKIALMFERFILRRASGVVAISQGIKSNLAYPRGDAVIIGNAIFAKDIDKDLVYKKIDTVVAKDKNSLHFGYVGSVIELEGLDKVLEACEILEEKGYQFTFSIAGEGSHAKLLRRKLSGGRPRSVRMLGRLNREQVTGLYKDIDCVVNYRNAEQVAQMVTPLKPLEALSMGIPVIASDVLGIRELIPNNDLGVTYVRPESAIDLANAMAGFIESREHFKKSIDAGIQYVLSTRTWEANAQAYASLYKDLLEN